MGQMIVTKMKLLEFLYTSICLLWATNRPYLLVFTVVYCYHCYSTFIRLSRPHISKRSSDHTPSQLS